MSEKELQAACEAWLSNMGYLRLTAKNAEIAFQLKLCTQPKSFNGWFGLLFRPQGNAFMPDLFIIDKACRILQVELKVKEKYGRGQREMIAMGYWKHASTLLEFEDHIYRWRYDGGFK